MEKTLTSLEKETKKEVAALYLRVSTKEQAIDGLSIENQFDDCKKFAEDRGWIIPKNLVFIEDESASKINNVNYTESTFNIDSPREEIRKLLNAAKNREFDHLLVHRRDRLSRVTEEALAINTLLLNNNIDIHYTKAGEEFNNDNKSIERFMHLIMLSLSEYESTLIASRTKAGNKKVVLDGFWSGGHPPIGYIRRSIHLTPTKTRSKLYKSNFESVLVKRIYELYNSGFGYKRIANIMNYEHGYIIWTKAKIEAIIKNKTYTGYLQWDRRGGKRNSCKHETVVSAPFSEDVELINNKDWELSKKLRQERNEDKDPNLHLTPYILKNKLFCSICDNKMIPINPGKNKTPVYLCKHCKDKRDINYCHRIPCDDVESLIFSYFKNECFSDNAPNKILYYKYCTSVDEINSSNQNFIEELNKQLSEVTSKLTKLNILINTLSPIDPLLDPLKKQKVTYEKLIHEYTKSKNSFEEKLIQEISESDFYNLFTQWKDKLLDTTITSQETLIQRRAFITTFINKLYVKKSSKTDEIIIDKIYFNHS